MLKRLFLYIAGAFVLILLLLLLLASKNARGFPRDSRVLMNKYYALKASNPLAAEDALRLILKQNPNDLPALIEWSQWLLQQDQTQRALPLLQRIHQRLPTNHQYNYQLGYAYYSNGQWEQATALFLKEAAAPEGVWKERAEHALHAMGSFLPFYQDWAAFSPCCSAPKVASNITLFKDPTDALKKQSTVTQIQAIQVMPERDATQKELVRWRSRGYLAIRQGRRLTAIQCFTRAYQLSADPALAMQLGYLYNQEKMNRMAYTYFNLATQSPDPDLAMRAQNALTNLVGEQTKALPAPYYGEIFAMPFSQTRFGLTVPQFIGRLGVEQTNQRQTKEYVYIRRTQDNRSGANLGELSQVYEDDVQITGVGVQFSPFPGTPLLAFGEMGAAYDLIDRDRNRWRSDVRGGLMYYQVYGQQPAYYDHVTIRPDYYSTWYADMTYFSRYNNNVIGVAKTHHGVRAVQYKSSLVNLYMRGLVTMDTQRIFYNNFAEIGPGVGFIPSDRYNVELRFEYINGMYLPAGAQFNPYGKYYTNKVVQLLVYVKI